MVTGLVLNSLELFSLIGVITLAKSIVRYFRTISSLLLLGLFAVMNLHSVLPHGHHEHDNEDHHHTGISKHHHQHSQHPQHLQPNKRSSAHDVFAENKEHHHHHNEEHSQKGLQDFFFFLLSTHAHGLEVPKPAVLQLIKDQVNVEKPSLSLLITYTFIDFRITDRYKNSHLIPPSSISTHFPINALRGPPTIG